MEKIGKLYICLVFLLLPLVAAADEFNSAIKAMHTSNYQYSANVWSKLSKQGNVVAEYNLAISLQKMQGDSREERAWLRSAARDRLITAYSRLQPASIRPARLASPAPSLGPQEWLQVQDPNFYTLQLASSTLRSSIEKYYERHQLKGKAGFYRDRRQGEDRYTLVYGVYPTASAARKAINDLPEALRKWKPWVRNIKEVQRIMQPLD